ncbi:hypothetical protein M885DRAFT_499650 [Pelagophyceae sp. CCMP2097]|nr:hypothetical protein M885DRAFT_499650 [Pelagophyceae sp. CCMP2097]|mmetsp:Transcript_28007/g.94333  ORF Transcript_28007/g.94333 Transcript_28007/m.94333 type:complete len:181 (+) Transcript_28007:199-741(+)
MFGRLARRAWRSERLPAAGAAFVLSSAGDLIVQTTAKKDEAHAGDGAVDFRRMAAQGTFSCLYASIVYVPWVHFLHKLYGPGRAVAKALTDNFFLCPVVSLPSYYAWTSITTGADTKEAVQRFRENFGASLVGSWCVWGPVLLATYKFVPLPYQVRAMYAGELAWASMMSHLSHRPAVHA